MSIISNVLKWCDVSEAGSYYVVTCKKGKWSYAVQNWSLSRIAGFLFCVLKVSKWQNPKCSRRFCDDDWDTSSSSRPFHEWHSNSHFSSLRSVSVHSCHCSVYMCKTYYKRYHLIILYPLPLFARVYFYTINFHILLFC